MTVAETQISLLRALNDGWNRMLDMLFRPFDLGKWFVVGFSAWLAGLTSWTGSGGGGGDWPADDEASEEMAEAVRSAWEWLSSATPGILALIGAGCLVLVALIVVLLWISSRGKLIFLDNVVHDRAAIVEPWKRLRSLGDSLFAFRLIVGLILFVLGAGIGALLLWLAIGPQGWSHLDGPGLWIGAITTALVAVLFFVTMAFLAFFLDAFVVPLMHRYDVGVLEGWRRFLPMLRSHGLWLVASGVFAFVAMFIVGIAIFTIGCMTCCLGFILLMIPYIGTVIMLPLLATYRAATVAFLAQIDPELSLDRGTAVVPEAPPLPPAGI